MATQPPHNTYDAHLGIEVEELGEELVRASVRVHDGLKQPMGLVHGGVYASIAEAVTVAATQAAVGGDGSVASGLANQTSFLRPITEGAIHATARRRHRGRTTWVWEVDVTDDAGRLCSMVRMTVAVRAPAAA